MTVVGPDDYRALFQDDEFLNAVYFSLITSFCATGLAFFLGVPTGYYLARKKGRRREIMDTIFDIPLVLPPLIIGVLLLMFFNTPLINRVYSFVFTTTGAITAQLLVAIPFTIKSAKSSFILVPPIFERVAMTLGAKPFRSFWDTTFKIAFPGIVSGLILTWLRCLGEFGATLLIGGGIPGKTANIPVNIYLNMSSGEFNKGIAASIVTVLWAFGCIMTIKMFMVDHKHSRNPEG